MQVWGDRKFYQIKLHWSEKIALSPLVIFFCKEVKVVGSSETKIKNSFWEEKIDDPSPIDK